MNDIYTQQLTDFLEGIDLSAYSNSSQLLLLISVCEEAGLHSRYKTALLDRLREVDPVSYFGSVFNVLNVVA